MNIHFFLAKPDEKPSPVRMVVTHNGKRYRKSVGITTSTWIKTKEKTGNPTIDARLRTIRTRLEEVVNELSTDSEVERAIAYALDDTMTTLPQERKVERRDRVSFNEYFEEWVARSNPAERQRKLAMRVTRDIMGCRADWEDVDSAYYFRLVQAMNERGYSANYQGAIIGKLKTVMSEGHKLKYHTNTDFREFHKPVEESDATALTEEEVERIWRLELTDDMERRVRDAFIVGIYTGARWEDYSRFTKANIERNTFTYVQQKTGVKVTIPCSPKVKEVMKRNGGRVPDLNQIVFNREVKVVCMKAGLSGIVERRMTKGGKITITREPKWKTISSHTARRTCATLLHKAGVPLKDIMVCTGHKNIRTLSIYLRTTSEGSMEAFKKSEFFK